VTDTVRLAVVSDIHATDIDGADSYVSSTPTDLQRGNEPLRDLLTYVKRHALKADYLVCPGDIANKADAVGLAHGWRQLNLLAKELEAKLVAAPGNHDLVTRAESADPRQALKQLLPSFPMGDLVMDEHFWRTGWTLSEHPTHRILIIDSTFEYPKYPATGETNPIRWRPYKKAIERGSFPSALSDTLSDLFDGLEPKINIAIVHHHPQEHQLKQHLKDEYGPMTRGDSLIELLSQHPEMGKWFIIHGHKHIPMLSSAAGLHSNGPLILCAASLGSKLWPPVTTVARNQFHMVSLSNQAPLVPGTLRGTVESHHWGFGEGWQRSERRGAGLRATSGFGHAGDFREIAQRIRLLMQSTEDAFVSFPELVAKVPELPYLLPTDFDFMENELLRHGLEFARGNDDRIMQLFKTGES
jgi:metallophosphoesterase superfamily enzyme